MKQIFLATVFAGLVVSSALAQTPAISNGTTNPAAPVAGANSFTEAQAKERIEKAGYGAVSGLAKDANGVWHGNATKAGSMTDVSVDFQGNVTSK